MTLLVFCLPSYPFAAPVLVCNHLSRPFPTTSTVAPSPITSTPDESGVLVSLLALVQTLGDYERLTKMLANGVSTLERLSLNSSSKVTIFRLSHDFDCALYNSRYQSRYSYLAFDILLHRLKFGISLRSATVVRQLMHALRIPIPSLILPLEEKKHIPYVERIEQALQFATLLPHPTLVPLTKAPHPPHQLFL